MVFVSPIIMSKKIQHKDPLLKAKAFIASFSLHASVLAATVYLAAATPLIRPIPEEKIVVSLAEYVSTLGDPTKIESPAPRATPPQPKPLPKTEHRSRPVIAKTQPLAPKPTVSSPAASTPEEKPSLPQTVSPEASAPLARVPSSFSSSSGHTIDSPQVSSSAPVHELPNTSVRSNDIGGAAFGHIRAMIEKAITYPSIARKLRIEGVVTVVFTLKPDGTVDSAKIQSTSGSRVLDTKAVDTILSLSGDYPPLGKTVELSIPIAFSLKKS